MKYKSEVFEQREIIIGQNPVEWFNNNDNRKSIAEFKEGSSLEPNPWQYFKSSHSKWEEIITSANYLLDNVHTRRDLETMGDIVGTCGLCLLFNQGKISKQCELCPLKIGKTPCFEHGLYEEIFDFFDEEFNFEEDILELNHNISVEMLFWVKRYGEALIKYLEEIMVLLGGGK